MPKCYGRRGFSPVFPGERSVNAAEKPRVPVAAFSPGDRRVNAAEKPRVPRYSTRAGILGVLVSMAVFGQAPAARPEFEVASIKQSAPLGTTQVRAGMHIDGAQVSWALLSLNDYIGSAYKVKNYQISGPEFLASDRFDITAKLPAGATPKDTAAMLQALLEDRFHLKLHRENKDFPVYGLVVGKGGVKIPESTPNQHKEEQSAGGERSVFADSQASGTTVNYGNGSNFTVGANKFEGRKLTPAIMAAVLARFADRPVVDMTDLKGSYDFVLEFSPEDFRAMMIRSAIAAGVALPPQVVQQAEAASGDSLFNAVAKLGLKLEPRKAPIEVLVIDHCEKTPTEN